MGVTGLEWLGTPVLAAAAPAAQEPGALSGTVALAASLSTGLADEDWAAKMRDEVDQLKMELAEPLVLEVPGSAPEPTAPSLRELVQEAVGVRMGGPGGVKHMPRIIGSFDELSGSVQQATRREVEDKKDQARRRAEEKRRERMEREGKSYLDQLESIAQRKDLDVSLEMREGDPYREIIDLADELGADLIVMGHSGRRGPRRKITGSVAERVIHFANCPVLIWRKRG